MTSSMELDPQQHPYNSLGPEQVLDAAEAVGFRTNGRILALNSYENRVYQIGIEDERPVVAKFYRPGRWSNAAILEEHAFTLELAEQEIPVVAPMRDEQGQTLHEHAGFRFAVFPSVGGRSPELDDLEQLEWLGRYIGRIHNKQPFQNRPEINLQRMVEEPAAFLLQREFIPASMRVAYEQVISELTQRIKSSYEQTAPLQLFRIHGDCHPGNILWSEQGPRFLDFDDTVMGPAIQDLWMLISGDRQERSLQLSVLLEGYETFGDFNRRELALIESLRSMRLVHYAGWLARRWNDPAFPMNFPWFNTEKYWEEHLLTLWEQVSAMEQPVLMV